VGRERYEDNLTTLERGLGDFAFSSRGGRLVDGRDVIKVFSDEWKTSAGEARLKGRSPVGLERDRILYSDELRSQSDKHHLLFVGRQKIARDFTSHTLRMTHVARSVSQRLSLNSELAEAISLGAKVGAAPFLHVSKAQIDKWVQRKIQSTDKAQRSRSESSQLPTQSSLRILGNNELALPNWVESLQSAEIIAEVKRCLPWAMGSADSSAYSSGQQSYWALTMNPYLLESRRPYLAQTMYGIWRHSLRMTNDFSSFLHELPTVNSKGGDVTHTLAQAHMTHEAVVVRYADDITWAIENLSEASHAAILDGGQSKFAKLARVHGPDLPDTVKAALAVQDSGRLYTYFIDDLVRTSRDNMAQADGGHCSESEPLIALSGEGLGTLERLKRFLEGDVFSDERIRHRNVTLAALTETSLDVLYESHGRMGPELIERRAIRSDWHSDEGLQRAADLLENPVHRIQACVDFLSSMSDRDVYDLIGLE
jgi:dGTP triphosphohydrolase